MTVTNEQVWDVLKKINDPEIHMSITDLGLVYGVDLEPAEGGKARVKVRTTLTTPACPYGPAMLSKIHSDLEALPGVGEVVVDLVWVPPWDPRTMASPEVKMKMGLLEFEDLEDDAVAGEKNG